MSLERLAAGAPAGVGAAATSEAIAATITVFENILKKVDVGACPRFRCKTSIKFRF